VTDERHTATAERPAPRVSAHFVNNVLAAAASLIDEDPDVARDVLAELGQFLAYGLREDAGPVGAAQELAHAATYVRLQQARFPDRIAAELPGPGEVTGRVVPGTIQQPLAELLGARLREHAGTCLVRLRADEPGALELTVSGADGADARQETINLAGRDAA
jgi:LytS/YehU family sensor histidine kinase